MSKSNLIRWSGLLSLLAGALYALGALLHPGGEDLAAVMSPNWVTAHLVYWAPAICMQLGLVGLYVRQMERTGWLALVSFVLAFIGTALAGSILFESATIVSLVAADAPATIDQALTLPTFAVPIFLLCFGLGYILFGLATMRAGVFPHWSGLLLVVGVSFFILSEAPLFGRTLSHMLVTVGDVIFGIGLAWMGYALWSGHRTLPG